MVEAWLNCNCCALACTSTPAPPTPPHLHPPFACCSTPAPPTPSHPHPALACSLALVPTPSLSPKSNRLSSIKASPPALSAAPPVPGLTDRTELLSLSATKSSNPFDDGVGTTARPLGCARGREGRG